MKLGLIVECAPKGLESVVCPRILQLLAEEAGVPIECAPPETMVNKKLLILRAAETARILLKKGCDRVVILWDENPPWTPAQDIAKRRCWHVEREQLLTKLRGEGIDRWRVGLVCIEREFETWLLHDEAMLRKAISTAAHRARIRKMPNPAKITDPKAALMQIFRENKVRYNPEAHARRFAECLAGLNHLKACDTFRYFAQSVLGKMPDGWKPYAYRPRGPGRS